MSDFVIKNNPSIRFPEDNEIVFFQDHSWWKCLPSNIDFFPSKQSNRSMWFIGDGYGILKQHGKPGTYGNGSIAIHKDQLPQEIWDWAVENQIDRIPH